MNLRSITTAMIVTCAFVVSASAAVAANPTREGDPFSTIAVGTKMSFKRTITLDPGDSSRQISGATTQSDCMWAKLEFEPSDGERTIPKSSLFNVADVYTQGSLVTFTLVSLKSGTTMRLIGNMDPQLTGTCAKDVRTVEVDTIWALRRIMNIQLSQ